MTEALSKYDVDRVKWVTNLSNILEEELQKSKGKLYILHPSQSPAGIQPDDPRVNFSLLKNAMNRCRVIKDTHEIHLIRKANEISAKAHSVVMDSIQTLKNEAEVEAIFKQLSISNGARHQSYTIIAASGNNASILHYSKNNEPLTGRELIVLDAGAEYSCYASDVTRTIPLGLPSPEWSGNWPSIMSAEIYSLVLKMQTECIRRLRPGVQFRDLHLLAHAILVRGFIKLGIFVGSEEDIMKQGTSIAFLPHGLGHHIGLEVHDVLGIPIWSEQSSTAMDSTAEEEQTTRGLFSDAGFSYLSEITTTHVTEKSMTWIVDPPTSTGGLQEGMVITVEPGIYFNAYALEMDYLRSPIHSKYINKNVLRRYLHVGGVRIEDDILITRSGHENLTLAPKVVDQLQCFQDLCHGTINHVRNTTVPCVVPDLSCADVESSVQRSNDVLTEPPPPPSATRKENRTDMATQDENPSRGPGPTSCSCLSSESIACQCRQLTTDFDKLRMKLKSLPRTAESTDWMCIDDFHEVFSSLGAKVAREWRSDKETSKNIYAVVQEELKVLYDVIDTKLKKLQSTENTIPEDKIMSLLGIKRAADTSLPIRTKEVKRGRTRTRLGPRLMTRTTPTTLWQNSLFGVNDTLSDTTPAFTGADRGMSASSNRDLNPQKSNSTIWKPVGHTESIINDSIGSTNVTQDVQTDSAIPKMTIPQQSAVNSTETAVFPKPPNDPQMVHPPVPILPQIPPQISPQISPQIPLQIPPHLLHKAQSAILRSNLRKDFERIEHQSKSSIPIRQKIHPIRTKVSCTKCTTSGLICNGYKPGEKCKNCEDARSVCISPWHPHPHGPCNRCVNERRWCTVSFTDDSKCHNCSLKNFDCTSADEHLLKDYFSRFRPMPIHPNPPYHYAHPFTMVSGNRHIPSLNPTHCRFIRASHHEPPPPPGLAAPRPATRERTATAGS